jgi:molecular chaperone GrpE (heat shock protein)
MDKMPTEKDGPPVERHSNAKEEPELKKNDGRDEPDEDSAKMCCETRDAGEPDCGIEEFSKLLGEAKSEAELYKNEAARAKADFYNYRTRIERDRARDKLLAAESTVDSLIPVLDNLDRTLQAVQDKESQLCKGVSMVQRQFFGVLQNLGLQIIETNCPFDPSQHEALMVVDVEDEEDDGRILDELHRGYKLGDKVLRAAQVKVGKKK